MKRMLTAVVLLFSLCCNLFIGSVSFALPNDVEDAKAFESVKFLSNIGIFNMKNEEYFNPQTVVSRGEFAKNICRLANLDLYSSNAVQTFDDVTPKSEYFSSIETLKGAGIISGDNGLFYPNREITYAEAIKMLCSVLNYDFLAWLNGGYPAGYIMQANKNGISISGKAHEDTVTRIEMARLLEAAAKAPVFRQDGYGSSNNFSMHSEITLLSEYHDIYKIKGIVTENPYSALKNQNGAGEGRLGINNIMFSYPYLKDGEYYDMELHELLGEYVEAYYKKDSSQNQLLYVSKRNEKEIEIKSDDIVSYNNNVLSYRRGTSVTDVRIPRDVEVIYNHKRATESFTEAMMMPEKGSIRLVASEGNEYNLVKIIEYKTVSVQNIDKSAKTIGDNSNSNNKIDFSHADFSYIYGKNNNKITFEDIKENQIISYMETVEKDVVFAYVSEESMEGKISKVRFSDGYMYVTVGDEEVKVSKYGMDLCEDAIKAGNSCWFYLDIFGNIAYVEADKNGQQPYGFLIAHSTPKELDFEADVKLLNYDGIFEFYKLTTKTYVDNVRYNRLTDTIQSIYTEEKFAQLVRYQVNNEGYLTRIDTVKVGVNEDEKYTLHEIYRTSGQDGVRYASGAFYDGVFALSGTEKVFGIPELPQTAQEYQFRCDRANVYFQSSTNYKFKAYSSKPDSYIADVLVAEGIKEGIKHRYAQLVKEVGTTINSNGDQVARFTLIGENKEMEYMVDDSICIGARAVVSADTYESDENIQGEYIEISEGDTIAIGINNIGGISYIELIYDESEDKLCTDDVNYSLKRLIKVENNFVVFRDTINGFNRGDRVSYDGITAFPMRNFKIGVYDKNSRWNKAYIGSAADLSDFYSRADKCDKVLIQTYGRINQYSLIVYKSLED